MAEMNHTTLNAAGGSHTRRSRSEGWAVAIRWAAAIVFVVFGVGKFVNHASEVVSFRQYSLPGPAAFVYLIGVLETGGGLLVGAGVVVRGAAVVLASDMIGAIVVSGFGRGEYVSLTLAPALLLAMLFLIRRGSSSVTDDRARHAASRRVAGRARR